MGTTSSSTRLSRLPPQAVLVFSPGLSCDFIQSSFAWMSKSTKCTTVDTRLEIMLPAEYISLLLFLVKANQ